MPSLRLVNNYFKPNKEAGEEETCFVNDADVLQVDVRIDKGRIVGP